MPVSAGQQHLCATAREARVRPKHAHEISEVSKHRIVNSATTSGKLLFTNGGAASLSASRALQRLPPTLPTGPSLI
jgi:hypothetical protein